MEVNAKLELAEGLEIASAGPKVTVTQMPSVGRIVLFEPEVNDLAARANYSTCVAKVLLPAIIVRVCGSNCVNLRVLTDGEEVLWRTSVYHGFGPRTWHWPERS